MQKTYIDLYETSNKKWFKGTKDWINYYLFSAGDERKNNDGIIYWCLGYKDIEKFNAKLNWEKVDADYITSIKEFNKNWKTRLWGMFFMNDDRKAYFVNLYENDMKTPDKEYDKQLVLTETEYREKAIAPAKEDADF